MVSLPQVRLWLSMGKKLNCSFVLVVKCMEAIGGSISEYGTNKKLRLQLAGRCGPRENWKSLYKLFQCLGGN